MNADPPSEADIRQAVSELKNGKSPGIDIAPPEALKTDIETSTKLQFPVIQKMWTKEVIPAELKKGLIIKLPKKGDLTCCGNWRNITLLTTASKVL